MTRLLLTENSCAMPSQRLGRFTCDGLMQVGEMSGEFASRLACDTKDVLGTGWQRFLYKCNPEALIRLERDKRAGIAGRYTLGFKGGDGHRLVVVVRTLPLITADGIRVTGTIDLQNAESPRVFIDLRRSGLR